MSDLNTYTVGSIASFLASSSTEKSHSPSKNQRKLEAMFNSSSAFSPLTAKAPKIIHPGKKEDKNIPVKKKKSKKATESNSSTLLQREESLRNADKLEEGRTSHVKEQTSNKQADVKISHTKLSKHEMNLLNAERRVKLKALKPELKEKKLKNERTVFVGNVALAVGKKDLLRLFKTCGKVEAVRLRSVPVASLKLPKKALVIKKEFHPQRHNMNAYVVFEDAVSAKAALKLNGQELSGLHLRVDLANMGKKHDQKKSVFVGNLPFDIEEELLRSHFEDCGAIENIRIVRDKTTGVGKGFGFIKFEDSSSVDLAIDLEGQDFHGRKLRIQRSTVKPKSKLKLSKSQTVKNTSVKLSGHSRKAHSDSPKSLPLDIKNTNGRKGFNRKGEEQTKNAKKCDKTQKKNRDVASSNATSVAEVRKKKQQRQKILKKKIKEKMKLSLGKLLTRGKNSE